MADKEKMPAWVQAQGNAVNLDKGDFKPEERNPVIEGARSLMREKQSFELARSVLGGDVPKEPPAAPQEPIATTIAVKAMEAGDKALGRMLEGEENLRKEIGELKKEAQQNMNKFLETSLARAQDIENRAKEMAAKALGEGAPEDKVISHYRQIKGLVQELDAERPATAPSSTDAHVQIELKKLELESARLLHQMSEDAAERGRKFELEIAQLKDNKDFKLMEYQDKKDFRKDGMEGLKGLVSAVDQARREEAGAKGPSGGAVAVSSEVSAEEPAAAPALPAGGEQKPARSAALVRFPCAACGAKIDVPDVDHEQSVDCPGCHAEYRVPKEGTIQAA